MKRAWRFIILISLLLGTLGIYFYHNGFVFVDGKYTTRVRLDFPKGEYAGAYACVPVIASLYELGYEQVSEYNDVIFLKKGEQVLTVDLNTLSLTCLQSRDNCIAPDGSNIHSVCIRKGQDIYVDFATFGNALKFIGSSYTLSADGPGCRIVKYTKVYDYEKWMQELQVEYRENAETRGSIEDWVLENIWQNPEEEEPDTVTKGRLIVNGVDLTEDNYVRIHQGDRNAEIPLGAIFQALNHDIDIQHNELLDRYEFVIDGEVYYHISAKNDENLLNFCRNGYCHRIENNDFIVDVDCVSSGFYRGWDAKIIVDYDVSTVYVFSCHPDGC